MWRGSRLDTRQRAIRGGNVMADRVGFIGLGLMGRPMALNLIKHGFLPVVHSRSQGPVDVLVKAGATAAASPAEVAER
jgi:2-hydroxy-3-oxopropionate reductase